MRWAPLVLVLVGLLAAPSAAAGDSAPAPELVRLDRKLAQVQEAEERGRAAPEAYKIFAVRFRADLEAAKAAAAPSPANTALYARILARLGEGGEAAADLERALKRAPNAPALRAALSQVRYDERNYPAALSEADAALKLDPTNKEALTLKHFSEGRAAMAGAADAASAPTLARRSVSRKIRLAPLDQAKLPYKLPFKIARAEPPPEPAVVERASPPTGPGPLPLLSLAGAASLGFAAFGVSRSRGSYESSDGLDDAHPYPYGRSQRFVAGALLTAMAAASLYIAGPMIVSAVPAALGAIDSGELGTANAVPRTLARVIAYAPGQGIPDLLGLPGKSSAFVTAAEDVEGLSARQLETKLGILPSPQYLIVRFQVPPAGLATPIDHASPQFIGAGLTSGGAREFLIPNGPVPLSATYEIVK